jgi:hypothetical protein
MLGLRAQVYQREAVLGREEGFFTELKPFLTKDTKGARRAHRILFFSEKKGTKKRRGTNAGWMIWWRKGII